jgi:preprotein translocase subunit SecF
MALIKGDIDFMSPRKRRLTGIISAVMLTAAILSLAINRFEFGLDFTSGTLIEVGYTEAVNPEVIRQQLIDAGYEEAVVVQFGSEQDLLVRLPVEEGDNEAMNNEVASLGDEVLTLLQASSDTPVEMRRSEFVGPKIGAELAERGGLALLVALGIVMLYVAVRFQYKFGIASVAALAHDVIVVLGVISLFRLTFDLTVLAALLAVIGYSLNDTIVVFDRVRENMRKFKKKKLIEVLNLSVNEMLNRTLMMTLTTVVVLVALFLYGGEVIHDFAFALIVGVLVGTYSSTYIAAPVVLWMNSRNKTAVQQAIEEETNNI